VFQHPERHFPYLGEVTPYLDEGLLLPFYVQGEPVGTIWIVGHDESCRFDAEDLRVMSNLADFAGGAYQALIALDRTKRANRQLEQTASALHENERRLNELISSMPAAVYTTDAAGRITFYNEAAAQLWGCRPELGKSEFCGSWKLHWPDGRPMRHDECPMAVTLKTGEPVRGAEAVAERSDGTRVPFLPYPTPLRDGGGQVVGAVNMLVDITDRKAFERTLRSQTRWFETLNRIAKIVSCDLDLGRVVQTVTDVVTGVSAKFGAFFQCHR
jgi:PAS domain S-box-containing protein